MSSKVVAPPLLIKACIGWALLNKHLNVLMHTGYMESLNWVASCVDELDDTLPRFTSVQWDIFWATHSVSAKAYTWKMALGW
jgi:hypothetical protein